VALSKITDFAGEGASGDAAVLGDYGAAKRTAVLAAMVHAAQEKARDDTAEMFCRRVATLTKRARLELEELKKQQQKVTEALIGNYRQVLEHLDPQGPDAEKQAAALEMARKTVQAAGGFDEEFARIDGVRATHGDNHVPLVVARHFRKDRAAMLAMVVVLDLEATSADGSVLQLLDYMREHTMMTRDHIPDRIGVYDEHGRPVLDERTGEQRVRMFDTSFASENWNKAIRDRGHPGMFVRRHLEACVLTYLADDLRTGDIAVTGAATYANWAGQLLTPAEVAERLPAFCAEVGIPGTAAGFRADLQTRLGTRCRAADAAYPDLADFAIDDAGRPSLKQYRAAPPTASGQALALALRDRMPERTLMGILARTGHWLEWWRRFSPSSGSDPKLRDPVARYILTTFTYGTNLGPAQAARHIAGVTAHELSTTSGRHVTIGKLNKAIVAVESKPDFQRKFLINKGLTPSLESAEQFAKELPADRAEGLAVIKASGLYPSVK